MGRLDQPLDRVRGGLARLVERRVVASGRARAGSRPRSGRRASRAGSGRARRGRRTLPPRAPPPPPPRGSLERVDAAPPAPGRRGRRTGGTACRSRRLPAARSPPAGPSIPRSTKRSRAAPQHLLVVAPRVGAQPGGRCLGHGPSLAEPEKIPPLLLHASGHRRRNAQPETIPPVSREPPCPRRPRHSASPQATPTAPRHPLAGPGRHRRRPADGRPGRHHREHRAALRAGAPRLRRRRARPGWSPPTPARSPACCCSAAGSPTGIGRRRAFLGGLVGFAASRPRSPGSRRRSAARRGPRPAGLRSPRCSRPTALSLVAITFTDARERAKAFGVYGAVASSGAAVGLLLGGVLTEYAGWRWCLFVNVAIAVVAFARRPGRAARTTAATPRPASTSSSGVLVTAGLAAIVLGCAQAAAHGWTSPRCSCPAGRRRLTGGARSWCGSAGRPSRCCRCGCSPTGPAPVPTSRSPSSVVGSFGMFLMLTYHFQVVLGLEPGAGRAGLPARCRWRCPASAYGLGSRLLPRVAPRCPDRARPAGRRRRARRCSSTLTPDSGYLTRDPARPRCCSGSAWAGLHAGDQRRHQRRRAAVRRGRRRHREHRDAGRQLRRYRRAQQRRRRRHGVVRRRARPVRAPPWCTATPPPPAGRRSPWPSRLPWSSVARPHATPSTSRRRTEMTVELNHTIVHAHDKQATARHLVEILGLPEPTTFGPFVVVQVANGVSLDFADDHGDAAPPALRVPGARGGVRRDPRPDPGARAGLLGRPVPPPTPARSTTTTAAAGSTGTTPTGTAWRSSRCRTAGAARDRPAEVAAHPPLAGRLAAAGDPRRARRRAGGHRRRRRRPGVAAQADHVRRDHLAAVLVGVVGAAMGAAGAEAGVVRDRRGDPFGVGETTIMAIQAWRGVPSHYNFTTTFDAVLMRGGAAGLAVVLLAGLAVLLVGVRRSDAPPAVRLGLTSGTLLLLVGCVIGFAMISNMSGVFQGSLRRRLRPPAGRLRRAAGVRRRPRGARLPAAHGRRRPGAAPRDRRARPGAARMPAMLLAGRPMSEPGAAGAGAADGRVGGVGTRRAGRARPEAAAVGLARALGVHRRGGRRGRSTSAP